MKKSGLKKLKKTFTTILIKWNREQNTRQMPWKGEKDPYKIWLSEIILQQTRVEQGLNYYKNFITAFPDVHKLAKAADEKIFKHWEGLGYYTRCRNLIASARYISKEKKGIFPGTYNELINLKGVGPYTAAAISSFAFNLPHAVVDGNVFRVLARVFGISKPAGSTGGKKFFTALADELLDKKQPGIYNQAIMDFGAVVCKPLAPLCTQCVFKRNCVAYLNNRVNELPLRTKKTSIKKRWFHYLVMEYKNEIVIGQRTGKDIWQQLFEFPLVEMNTQVPGKILKEAETKKILAASEYEIVAISPLFKQQLSHQLIEGRFIRLKLKRKPKLKNGYLPVARNKLSEYAFPQFINQYLRKKAAQKHLS